MLRRGWQETEMASIFQGLFCSEATLEFLVDRRRGPSVPGGSVSSSALRSSTSSWSRAARTQTSRDPSAVPVSQHLLPLRPHSVVVLLSL